MENVKATLTTILEGTRFDLEFREYVGYSPADGSKRGTLRNAKAQKFREVYEQRVAGRNMKVSARQYVPEELLSGLEQLLRDELKPFIDPKTGRIGHTFPIQGGSIVYSVVPNGALFCYAYYSELHIFARALVQAAAVMGIESVTSAMEAWCQGEPIEFQMATVLSNLFLNANVSPKPDINLVPLGLSTAELPRLPKVQGDKVSDYLGLTLVKLELSTSGALFRPGSVDDEERVRPRSAQGVTLELVRDALSLMTNRHVTISRKWLEYPSAWGFYLSGPGATVGTDRPRRRPWKSMTSSTEGTVLTPDDEVAPVPVDAREIDLTITALRNANTKLQIAVDRWHRSMSDDAQLEDRYIDLRIALEAIYLKDFANEYSGEMRFRLALFGAWHLGTDFEERRSIRKALRDAYDTASKAVHEGKLPSAAQLDLAMAQDLCRRGILKHLREGPPADWGEMILGPEL